MRKNAKLHWVRLPIETLENCRELGGYSTKYGQQTKWHSFLRSSDMSKLGSEDIEFLKEYGVKTVIDLRGSDESETHGNPLADVDFCEYHQIPFITQQVTDISLSTNVFMGDFYVDLIEKSTAVKEIFHTMAKAEEGCIVFHCQAGKDRTGILAMLLLGLAGVEKKDIISNYEVTYTNLESLHQKRNSFADIPSEFLYSHRDYIIRAFDYIQQTYQNVEHFLIAKGVDHEAIEIIKGRLLGLSKPVA